MSGSRISLTNVTVAVVLLAAALAIVIWSINGDGFLLPIIFLLVLGGYMTGVGLAKRVGQGTTVRKSNGNYLLFWGNLLLIISVLLLVDHYYPGNLLWIAVIFIVWLALAVLLFTLRPKAKN